MRWWRQGKRGLKPDEFGDNQVVEDRIKGLFDVKANGSERKTGLEGSVNVLGEEQEGLIRAAAVRAKPKLSGREAGQDGIEGDGG